MDERRSGACISAHEFAIRDRGGLTSSPGEIAKGKKSDTNFADTLSELVKETSDLQKNADQSLEDFAAGKVEDMHHVMMSMNRADLSFRMMLEVRNKLVEAYTEIMRTQV